jgi:hypothetical protein
MKRRRTVIPYQPRKSSELRPCRGCRDIWITPTRDGRCPYCGTSVMVVKDETLNVHGFWRAADDAVS